MASSSTKLPQNNSEIGDYVSKLQCLELPDPYSIPESEWLLDFKLWPSLVFPQIHLYLINTPSFYTHQNKGAYKSLDAYKSAMSGHAQRIKYHPISAQSDFCFVIAEVLPRQHKGEKTKMYTAWVCLHKQTAEILTAHCTCMAGSGPVCSHAAAVMFKMELAVRTGLTQTEPCISVASKWNDMSRKKVTPAPLTEIDLTKPKRKTGKQKRKHSDSKTTSKPEKTIKDEDILELRDIYPQAAVLTTFDFGSEDATDTDTASDSDETL